MTTIADMIRWYNGIEFYADGSAKETNFVTGRTKEYPSPGVQLPKETKMPVYNDPNHPDYGPCRRLHLILLYLFGDELATVEADFKAEHGGDDWTKFLSERREIGVSEARTARDILTIMLRRFYRS